MADYTVRRFEEMEPMLGGMFRRARASLGATSFGMQILELPPDGGGSYLDHDHRHDSQEEVYVVLNGSADFNIDGQVVRLEPDTAIRIAPAAKRKLKAGPRGVRMLVLGGVPGAAYQAPAFTQLGGPEQPGAER
jgi:mannose-6-phosphate isomerase-like protein (cupin superfamily)